MATNGLSVRSWQPALVRAFLTDYKELCELTKSQNVDIQSALTSYMLGDRGWHLLHCLAHTSWITNPDVYDNFGDLEQDLLLPFVRCLTYASREQEYIEDDTGAIDELKQWSSTLDARLDQSQQRKRLSTRHPHSDNLVPNVNCCFDVQGSSDEQSSSDDDDDSVCAQSNSAHNHHSPLTTHRSLRQTRATFSRGSSPMLSKSNNRTRTSRVFVRHHKSGRQVVKVRRPEQLMYAPALLQEDTDGFPYCWNEHNGSQRSSRQRSTSYLDDSIVDQLFAQLSVTIECRTTTSVVLMLCRVLTHASMLIRKRYRHNQHNMEQTSTAWLLGELHRWIQSDVQGPLYTILNDLEPGELLNNGAELTKCQHLLVVSAHGTRVMTHCIRLLCESGTDHAPGYDQAFEHIAVHIRPLVTQLRALTDWLQTIVELIDNCDYEFWLTGRICVDDLFENALDLATQLFAVEFTCSLIRLQSASEPLLQWFDLFAVLCSCSLLESTRELLLLADTFVTSPFIARLVTAHSGTRYIEHWTQLMNIIALRTRPLDNKLICCHRQQAINGQLLIQPNNDQPTKCVSAVLLSLLVNCARNVTCTTYRAIALNAIQAAYRCRCCINNEQMLSLLCQDSQLIKTDNYTDLWKCLKVHLDLDTSEIDHFNLLKHHHAVNVIDPSVAAPFVASVTGMLQSSSETPVVQLSYLLIKLAPVLSVSTCDQLLCHAVLPTLRRWIDQSLSNSDVIPTCQCLLKLANVLFVSISQTQTNETSATAQATEAFTRLIHQPKSESIFEKRDFQTLYLNLVTSAVPFEPTNIDRAQLAKWLLDQFMFAHKLCCLDFAALIAGTTADNLAYWQLILAILQVTTRSLTTQTESFTMVFNRADGFGLCSQLLSTSMAYINTNANVCANVCNGTDKRYLEFMALSLKLTLQCMPTEKPAQKDNLLRLLQSFFCDRRPNGKQFSPVWLHRICSVFIDCAFQDSTKLNLEPSTSTEHFPTIPSCSSLSETGYEGDIDHACLPDFASEQPDTECSSTTKRLAFPDLCVLTIKTLQSSLPVLVENGTKADEPDTTSSLDYHLTQILQQYRCVCSVSAENVRVLKEHGFVNELHALCTWMIANQSAGQPKIRPGSESDSDQDSNGKSAQVLDKKTVHTAFELLTDFLTHEPTAADLRLLLELVKQPNDAQAFVIETLLKLFNIDDHESSTNEPRPQFQNALTWLQLPLPCAAPSSTKSSGSPKSPTQSISSGIKQAISRSISVHSMKKQRADSAQQSESRKQSRVDSTSTGQYTNITFDNLNAIEMSVASDDLRTVSSTSSQHSAQNTGGFLNSLSSLLGGSTNVSSPPVVPPSGSPRPQQKASPSSKLKSMFRSSQDLITNQSLPNSLPLSQLLERDAAVLLPLDGLRQATLMDGLSAGFWCQLQSQLNSTKKSKTRTDPYHHLITVGSAEFYVSLRVHSNAHKLVLRLCSRGECLQEAHIPPHAFRRNQLQTWTHVALGAQVTSEMNQLRLAVHLNGTRVHAINVTWSYEGINLTAPCAVALGFVSQSAGVPLQTGSSNVTPNVSEPNMRLGNLMVFRGLLDQMSCIFLSALGTRCATVTDSKCRTLLASAGHLLRPRLLTYNQEAVARLLADSDVVMQQLQTRLLLTMQPDKPGYFTACETPNVHRTPGSNKSAPGNTSPDIQASKTMTNINPNSLFETVVFCRAVIWNCKQPEPSRQPDLFDALLSLGGTKLLMMVFAMVVDQGSDERTQTFALRLLIRCAEGCAEMRKQFESIRGCSLIAKILQSRNAKLGFGMMQEICELSLYGGKNLVRDPKFTKLVNSDSLASDNEIELLRVSDSTALILRFPSLLGQILTTVDTWKTEDRWVCWPYLAYALVHCISSDQLNTFRTFNIMQMQRVDMLKRLLHVLLDISSEQSRTDTSVKHQQSSQLPTKSARLIVAIVDACLHRSLMESVASGNAQADVNTFSVVWDFLFLSHPAACTYLNYRVVGHSDWLNAGTLNEQPVNLVGLQSSFVALLHRYIEALGIERIGQLMSDSDGQVSSVRRALDQHLGSIADSGLYSFPVNGSDVQQRLSQVQQSPNQLSAPDLYASEPSSFDETTSDSADDIQVGIATHSAHTLPRRRNGRGGARQPAPDWPDIPELSNQHQAWVESASKHTAAPTNQQQGGVLKLRDSVPHLPDLVCDVPAGVTGTTGSSDMGIDAAADDEWTGSSGLGAELQSGAHPFGLSSSNSQFDKLMEKNAFYAHDWLLDTRAGLFDLLASALQTRPDDVAEQLVQNVVKWQSLIVMLNHQPNMKVRAACTRALCAALMRIDDVQRIKFLKSHGFTLLANQLHEFPCNMDVADCLFGLLCGEAVRLETGLDAHHLQTLPVDRFQCGALEPILALFENSVHEISVFWNVTSALQKIFEHSMVLEQALLDKHLIEALVNVLQKLSQAESSEIDLAGVEERTLMLEAWHTLATRVLQNCLAYTDLIHHQACIDLITLMFTADCQFAATSSRQASTRSAHGVIRRELCALLQTWLETIKALYSSDTMRSASTQQSMESIFQASSYRSRPSTPALSSTGTHTPLSASRQSLADSQVSFSLIDPTSMQTDEGGLVRSQGLLTGSFSNLRYKLQGLSMSAGQLSVRGVYRQSDNGHQMASQSELVERLKLGLQYCSDVFLHLTSVESTFESDEEQHLFEYFFYFLLGMARAEANREAEKRSRRSSDSARSWQRLLVSCREKHRQLLAHLVAFVLYPARIRLNDSLNIRETAVKQPTTSSYQTPGPSHAPDLAPLEDQASALEPRDSPTLIRRRLVVVRAFAHEMHYKHILKNLLDLNIDYQYAMNLALHELLLNAPTKSSPTDRHRQRQFQTGMKEERWFGDVDKLLRFLKHLKVYSPLAQGIDETRLRNVANDERLSLLAYQELRHTWLQRLRNAVSRLRLRQQNAVEPISESAMSITCQVVGEQNVPRKSFIQRTKWAFADGIKAEEVIRQLLEDLSHPAALCHDASAWPQHWGLDPTEGPNRERRRLMPRPLDIAERFVLPEARHRLNAERHALRRTPLSSIVTQPFSTCVYPAVRTSSNSDMTGQQTETSDELSDLAAQLIDRLRIDENIAFSTNATILRSTIECHGDVLLGEHKLYFVGDSSRTTQKGLPQQTLISLSWSYSAVSEVYKRHHQLQDVAVEIFFSDGETFLICFHSAMNRNEFLQRLMTMNLSNLIVYADNLLHATTQWWREGLITNFEYLMHLNKLGGRTFSDLMQYPVFPFILADYTNYTLDLLNPLVYRNLAKPISIQNKMMEDYYMKAYKDIETEIRHAPKAASQNLMFLGPYHYTSHYSNSGTVIHYLVRVPPYTSMALEYQDDNFDVADRLFSALDISWRLSSCESTTDCKELIPEFFFFPEMFLNFERLDFGVRQSGSRVNDVILPQWVPDNDPRLFVLVHRQALESQQVTATLHQWIDLVFGYKQTGQSAVDAINVFHPATYPQTQKQIGAHHDELQMNALKTMVRTYGQMPKQLFRTPHLPHLHAKPMLIPTTATTNRASVKSPIASVQGVRWGIYVGSPETANPELVLKQRPSSQMSGPVTRPHKLYALPDGACIGLTEGCQLMAPFRPTKTELVTPWSSREVDMLALFCWSFPDSVVRGRVLSPAPGTAWLSLLTMHDHTIICSAFTPITNMVYLGLESGVVRVYSVEIENSVIKDCVAVREFIGHTGAVTAIDVCHEYSVVVTGSKHGELFMWDMNRLSFIRAFDRSPQPITHICISRTSCDIICVTQSDQGYGSQCQLHTCNGRLVGAIDSDITVTSVAMTSLPEGTAVNAVALGLQNGVIRMFDMWTMSPIREISNQSFLEPIVSVCFAQSDRQLYACTKSGAVLCWECVYGRHSRPPRFIFAHPKMARLEAI